MLGLAGHVKDRNNNQESIKDQLNIDSAIILLSTLLYRGIISLRMIHCKIKIMFSLPFCLH